MELLFLSMKDHKLKHSWPWAEVFFYTTLVTRDISFKQKWIQDGRNPRPIWRAPDALVTNFAADVATK